MKPLQRTLVSFFIQHGKLKDGRWEIVREAKETNFA